MDPKLKLLAKIDDAKQAIDAIFAKAESESRPLNDEERASVKAHEETADKAQSDLKKIEADEEARAKNVALGEFLKSGRKTKTPAVQPGAAPAPETTKPLAEDDPKRGFKDHREYMAAVMAAGQGLDVDERLRGLTVGSDEGRTNSDPAGGFLIPIGFSPNLMMVEPEADPISAAVTNVPMENPTVKIPARTDKDHSTSVSGGVTVTRKPETVSATSSQTTVEQVVLQAHGLFGLSYATEELLTDSPMSFLAILEKGFKDQFKYKLINERLFGTGVGEFLGVVNSPALVTIAKETGQGAATIVYENVLKMRARCWGYGQAFWLANHDCLPALMLMNQSIGSGGIPVFQPGDRLGMVNSDVGGYLLGRPLIFTEYTKTVGTTGDIILCNWSEYLEGLYQPMQSAESIHVRFVNHERAFKFWLRNAGQPWWKTALTPNQGSNTLSPYVALASR